MVKSADDNLRVFETNGQIDAVVERTKNDIKQYSSKNRLKNLHWFKPLKLLSAEELKAIESKGKKLPEVEVAECGVKDVRKADVLCMPGILYDDVRIGAIMQEFHRLLEATLPPDQQPQTYACFDPIADRHKRITEAYAWNKDKTHRAGYTDAAAQMVWQAKFLDEQGRLLSPKDFKGFTCCGYSIAAREIRMMENALYDELRKRGADVKKYFDKIRILDIGYGMDVENLPERPHIPSLTLLGQNDRGVAYRASFALDYISNINLFRDGEPYQLFPKDDHPLPPGHKLLLLAEEQLEKLDLIHKATGKQRLSISHHGLVEYVKAAVSLFENKPLNPIAQLFDNRDIASSRSA